MLRIKDLAAYYEPDAPNPAALVCPRCESRYSANPGDYFTAAPDEHLRCSTCRERYPRQTPPALQLARVRTMYEVIAK